MINQRHHNIKAPEGIQVLEDARLHWRPVSGWVQWSSIQAFNSNSTSLNLQAKILGLNLALKQQNEVHHTGLGHVHSSYSQRESTSWFIMQSTVLSLLFLITEHRMLPIKQKGMKIISKAVILSLCMVSSVVSQPWLVM